VDKANHRRAVRRPAKDFQHALHTTNQLASDNEVPFREEDSVVVILTYVFRSGTS